MRKKSFSFLNFLLTLLVVMGISFSSYGNCLPYYQQEISKSGIFDWKTPFKKIKKIVEDAQNYQPSLLPKKESLKMALSLGKFLEDVKKFHLNNPEKLDDFQKNLPPSAAAVAEILKFSNHHNLICPENVAWAVPDFDYEDLLEEFPNLIKKYHQVKVVEQKLMEMEKRSSFAEKGDFSFEEMILHFEQLKELFAFNSLTNSLLERFYRITENVLTPKQVARLSSFHSEKSKLPQLAYAKKGMVKTPQDFLELFDGLQSYANFSPETVEAFFAFNPSFEELKKFSKFWTRKFNLREEILERKLAQSPDQFLQIFENYQGYNFEPQHLDIFFNYPLVPTAEQVHKLVMTSHQSLMPGIRTIALEKGIVHTPEDFLMVFDKGFSHESKVYDFTPELLEKYFFVGPERPSMGNLALLLQRSKNQESVLTYLFSKSLITDPETALALIKEIGMKDLPESVLDQLFLADPPPALDVVLALADIPKDKLFLRLWAYKVFPNRYAPTVKDFLILFSGHGPHPLSDDVIDDFFAYRPRPSERDIHRLITLLKPEKHAKVKLLRKKLRLEREAEIIESFDQCAGGDREIPAKDFLQENSSWLKLVNVESKTCPICFEDKVDQKFYFCPHQDCSHSSCLNCFKDSIALQVREKKFPLSCDQCHKNWNLRGSDLPELDFQDKSKSEEIKKGLILAQYLHDHPNSIACATPDCLNRYHSQGGINLLDKDHHFDCRFCGEKTCVKCQERHPGKNCEEHRKLKKGDGAFQEMVHDPRSHVRPCPHCFKPQQRGDGCNFITCEYCKGQWDFIRGKWQSGWQHTYDNIPRTYRIPGDKSLKDGKEYTHYQEGVGDDWTKN